MIAFTCNKQIFIDKHFNKGLYKLFKFISSAYSGLKLNIIEIVR